MSKEQLLLRAIYTWCKLFIKLCLISSCCILLGGASFATPGTEGIQIYQKNIHLLPEHKQKLADDITRYRNADNLWDVLRDEFSLSHYEDNPAVQDKIDWYMNNQDFLLRSASRAAPYLYYILQQTKKRHLPAEVVLLPIIESGYNPFNVSSVGAAGIWQLMPGTATGLGVKQDWWYDGRRDVIASTRAALNHLSYLEDFFEGDWLLAFAAYDTGEGNVQAAIRKNIRNGRDTSFWSLPVAQETKNYVPSLLALATIIGHPEKYPIYFPPVRNAPYLAQIDVGKQINLKYAATLAGISYKQLLQLNPGFRPTAITKGPTKLVLPIENVEQFTENLARSPLNNQIRWIHYKIKSGDTMLSIAKKFNINTNDLRKMNHLTIAKKSLKPGTDLLIPTNQPILAMNDDVKETISQEAALNAVEAHLAKHNQQKETKMLAANLNQLAKNFSYRVQPGDTIYMVRQTDTLENIAKHFHLSANIIQAVNHLTTIRLKTGKQIIIPTHHNLLQAANMKNNPSQNVKPGDTLYMVRKGDTLEKIAKKFKTSAAVIRLTNLMSNRPLETGEQLVIPARFSG